MEAARKPKRRRSYYVSYWYCFQYIPHSEGKDSYVCENVTAFFSYVQKTEEDPNGFIFRRLDGPLVEEAATEKTSASDSNVSNVLHNYY